MRKLRLRAAVLTLFLFCASGGFFYLGAQAFTTFLPPRTAVVDISKVFDEYQKQIDKSAELKAAVEKTTRLLDTLKEGITIKEEELKSIKQESPTYVKILSEALELKRKFREAQKKGTADIAKQQTDTIKMIRAEISKEIETVATTKELDLVLEKAVTAELQRGAGFHWKIVHFSKPEYDITKEVTDRLNQRYKRG
ncbi:MAG: OmpH family outer membrane protein [Planctomycetota bacterium]|nr:OmpH family outer membrane protein [Planctomycetota bacterium]